MNLLETSNGDLKANFIQGTTVSGVTYHVEETSQGVFEGHIKGQPETFFLRLEVSHQSARNQYIEGYRAKLQVNRPSVVTKSGEKYLETDDDDHFVCGKQIRNYRS